MIPPRGPELVAEMDYRRKRVRTVFAIGQNDRAAEHQLLKTAFNETAERFRKAGTEADRRAMYAALAALEAFENNEPPRDQSRRLSHCGACDDGAAEVCDHGTSGSAR